MASKQTAVVFLLLSAVITVQGCNHPPPETTDPSQGALGNRSVLDAKAEVTIRLGAWNIKKLGHGSSKDYELVAQVIEENFDVLAIVEVMQKGGGHPGYDDLMDALGEEWDGFVTGAPRPNTSAGYAEFYAVIWQEDVARPCDGWDGLRYHEDGDGSDDSGEGDEADPQPGP